MRLPYDGFSVAVIITAAVLMCVAWRRPASRGAVCALVLAALVIRLDASWQHSLHQWDEQYHALVARNMVEQPLTPMLYRTPALAFDYTDWTSNQVWLHKPPLAMWMMAGSMRLLGVDAIPMRLPGVLLSTFSVLLTFLIATALLDRRVGLLAATFQAVNGFLVALASGRRVADHVDTALIFFIELSVYLALLAVRGRRPWFMVASGAAMGCALLAKSVPGLLAVVVVMAMVVEAEGWKRAFVSGVTMGVAALAVAAPWNLYAWWHFPREFVWESSALLRHITEPVEAAQGGPFSYLLDLPRFFGETSVVAVLVLIAAAVTRTAPRALIGPTVWVIVPYVVFSAAATRMPEFVMIGAAGLFMLHAYAWWRVADTSARLPAIRRRSLQLLLAVMAVLPARYLLEPTGAFERRDRSRRPIAAVVDLDRRQGTAGAVLFNAPRPIESMFYTRFTASSRMPTPDELRGFATSGRPVVVYSQ